MDNQETVDSSKVATRLLNKLATETWNTTIQEVKLEELMQQLKAAKEENLALKKELASLNDVKKG
ncbi:hypothetical protein [Lactobacillus taiwanensis]|uniref:hypothetical protein n=1 Tax=Lactobacillus taiwanensis TaxID=508451 RepID=UPI0025A99F3D|nr:hypothetical protein [Lactobacillus taiwanensis]